MFAQALRALRPSLLATLAFTFFFSTLVVAGAQTAEFATHPVADRLTAPIVESSRVTLHGTVHSLATKANDRGAVPDGMKLDRIHIVLKRSDAQEASLKQLIGDLHTPGTASYHKWLTPDDFGKQFGPSDADVAKLESWLASKGFSITKLNPGRQTLEIAGTAGQFKDAFHTAIHSFQVTGASSKANAGPRFSNIADPEIPAAIAPVFGGFVSLNNFRFKSHAQVLGHAQFNAETHESKPDWTIGSATNYNLVLAPNDFNVQYDLNPLYTAGTTGAGVSIAIVNEANINVAQVNNYRKLFGLPTNSIANVPQVIIDGNDPGIDGINSPYGPNYASGEAYLDVEFSGAVAPDAQINLVIANDTAIESGLTLAIERAVYSNISPIINLSFGECEANQGSFNGFINGLWEQAAAQGITVMVSTGDNGSAGCDDDNTMQFAENGAAVNGLASTPFNVAVGGTDFYYKNGTGDLSTYWNLTPTNSTPTVSLLKVAPEQPWNDSQYGLNLYSNYAAYGSTSIVGGSGGASSAGVYNSASNSYGPYAKPSWQTGTGVPNDKVRDLPDVSLFAANGNNNTYYPFCASDGDCEGGSFVQISGVGGTSASAPSFAGMMALVNQKYGRQGQANYVLYPLAAQFPSVFHDVIAGTNSVPCDITNKSKDCIAAAHPITVTDQTYGTVTEGEISVDGKTAAYNATAGYDLATGLGTIDAANMVNDWNKVTFGATTTTLTASQTSFTHGTAVTIAGSVKPPSGGTTPTGDVALVTTSTDPNAQAQTYFTLSGGNFSRSINYLPGGTYNIYGVYGGDAKNGESQSTPTQVTVNPEASTTLLTIYGELQDSSDNYTAQPLAAGSSISYGSPAVLSAQLEPSSTAEQSAGYSFPTGSVVFLDGSTTINTAVVNAESDAEFNKAFLPGSHSITAKYSGDGSYNASTSAAKTFTVTKNTPTFQTFFFNSDTNGDVIGGQVTYLQVALENSASPNSAPLSPTGTVTITGAPSGTPTTATLVSSVDPQSNVSQATASFAVPANASGNYNIGFSYGGDANYNTASIASSAYTFAGGIGLNTTTSATATAAATSPSSRVSVSVTVAGQSGHGAPTGTVYLVSGGFILTTANLPTSSGTSASLSVSFNSANLFQGTNQIQVFYSGDNTYNTSSAVVTVANPLSDFSLVPVTTIVKVPGTGTGAGVQTDTINVASYNGFAGAVGLTCSGTGGVTCSLSSNSSTLTSGGQNAVTLTVNTTKVTAAGTYNVVVTGTDPSGKFVHTIGLQVVTPLISTPSFTLAGTAVAITAPGNTGNSTITVTPASGFTGTVALTCSLAGPTGAVSAPTCSASSASVTGTAAATATLTFNTTATTTAGTYTATVTGTSGSTTANTTVSVVVSPAAAAASFTLAGTDVAVATPGGTGNSTITVTPANGFTGTVALTCSLTGPSGAVSAPTCSAASASVTGTAAATATLTFNTTSTTTAGSYTATVTGTSGSTTATTTVAVTVTAGSFTLSGTAVTIASQGASGTSTISVSGTGGFSGTINLTCAVTTSPMGASELPTCVIAPASVMLSATTNVVSPSPVMTISTTAQTASLTPASKRLFGEGGGAVLALLAFFGFAGRRSKRALKSVRAVRILSMALLFALVAGVGIGCGGGGTAPPSGGTSPGAYVVTVTGTSGTTTATAAVSVTVN